MQIRQALKSVNQECSVFRTSEHVKVTSTIFHVNTKYTQNLWHASSEPVMYFLFFTSVILGFFTAQIPSIGKVNFSHKFSSVQSSSLQLRCAWLALTAALQCSIAVRTYFYTDNTRKLRRFVKTFLSLDLIIPQFTFYP